MNKRIISKRQLEIKLDKLETVTNPKLGLEQYPVSAEAASELLYMAGFEHDDLDGPVVDLGTGSGRLAIGATLLGSDNVLGLDIDRGPVRVAVRNARNAGAAVEWVVGSLDCITGKFDTVLMNPPYGTRMRHQDIRFLSKAFELAPVTYSMHKSSTRQFLVDYVTKRNRHVDQIRSVWMPIPHIFGFHRKKWETIEVDLCRIEAMNVPPRQGR